MKSFLLDKIAGLLKVEGLQGIHFDNILYVDVFLPKELQPKYNVEQKDIMPEFDYGYHPCLRQQYKNVYGVDPLGLPDYAHDKTWFDFRLAALDSTVIMLKNEINRDGLISGAAVFPSPAMLRKMVRQDWGKWGLDWYFPMIYHNFYAKNI